MHTCTDLTSFRTLRISKRMENLLYKPICSYCPFALRVLLLLFFEEKKKNKLYKKNNPFFQCSRELYSQTAGRYLALYSKQRHQKLNAHELFPLEGSVSHTEHNLQYTYRIIAQHQRERSIYRVITAASFQTEGKYMNCNSRRVLLLAVLFPFYGN